MRGLLYFFFFTLCLAPQARSQSAPVYHDELLRREVARHSALSQDSVLDHTSFPIDRRHWDGLLQRVELPGAETLKLINNDLWLTQRDSSVNQRPFLGTFYRSPAHFFEVNQQDFYLRLNPILDFQYQHSQRLDYSLWKNQRGIELRFGVDEKVFMYARVFETQQNFPAYINAFIDEYDALPGQGFFKTFSGGFPEMEQAYDFLNGDGGLGYRLTPHIDLHIGHGRHFIGSGMRSLLLSDFADNYFFLKLNTQVGKFRYQNIYAELNPDSPVSSDGASLLPKKYMTAHYLTARLGGRWQVGLFEAVTFSRNNQFELQYLNPIILYRTVEQKIGSPDNVLLGLNLEYRPTRTIRLYGQAVIDELVVSEFFGPDEWWGNKQGYQLGAQCFQFLGIRGLDAQLEYNKVRPFTYAHRDSSATYSHSRQALAHPLGANFDELLLHLDYRPCKSVQLQFSWMHARRGLDDMASVSYGSNVLKSTSLRAGDFGQSFLQGQLETLDHFLIQGFYELKPSLYLHLSYRLRVSSMVENESVIGMGLRYNAPFRSQLF